MMQEDEVASAVLHINLASRIESMGVPGAMLFSRHVEDHLLDEPDLQLISFTTFAFKNIAEPVEVCALATPGFKLPRNANLKGKFKEDDPIFTERYVLRD